MCGHVGMAGEITFKEERMFKDMLKMDVIRGIHATGVTSLRRMSSTQPLEVVTAKKALDAYRFLQDKVSDNVFAGFTYMLLGHNRHATRGAIIDENSHPFEFPKLVGAHNGSLTSYASMHNAKDYQVDSQALYSELNENGVDSMWSKVNGAASLVWYDREHSTINMLRNKERPMVFHTMNKGRTLVWASEAWMLYSAAYRNDLELDEGKPTYTTVNQHYEFKFPKGYLDKGGVEVTTREVKPYTAPPVVYQPYRRDWSNNTSAQNKNLLVKENIVLGGEVTFTVDKISDYFDGREQRCAIEGKTENGTPIRIYSVLVDVFDDLVNAMWESDEALFCGKVMADTGANLIVSMPSVVDLGFTLSDLAEAEAGATDVAVPCTCSKNLDYCPDCNGDNRITNGPVILCSQCGIRSTVYHKLQGGVCICEECHEYARKSLH